MELNVQLSLQQIKQIASCIPIKDIQDYIENNPKQYEEYEQLSKEQQQDNQNKQLKEDTKEKNTSAIWQQYVDDTICTVSTNKANEIDMRNTFNNSTILVESKSEYSLELEEITNIKGGK